MSHYTPKETRHPKLDRVHIRACFICTRSIIADDADLTLSCASPEVSGLNALVPVKQARDSNGACGPEARFMQFQRSHRKETDDDLMRRNALGPWEDSA